MYSAQDIRQEGLGGFEFFHRVFLVPDRSYDAPAITEKLQLDPRILKALGLSVPPLDVWPPVLLFTDYVYATEAGPSFDRAIQAARRVSDPDSIVARLIEYADRNNVRPITLTAVQNDLRGDRFVADSTTADRVNGLIADPSGCRRYIR